MNRWSSKQEPYLAAALSAIVLLFLLLQQKGIVDQADGILHYQFAKFIFAHPENAFNHWAKPLYTVIMAGPAMMGMVGIRLMNVLFIAITSYAITRSAQELNLKGAWLIGVFAGIGNSITYVVLGGLTEPLFMVIFSGVIYYSIKGNWSLMYTLLGASLLVRPEAIVILPVFTIYGLLNAKIKYAFYGLVVPGLFTIMGMIVADYDWHWIITNQPYGATSQPYGHGDWVHYIHQWHRISPWIMLILAVLSLVSILREKRIFHLFLFIASFGIVALHVVLWRYGWMGSAGLARTMTTALPGLALCAGFFMSDILPKPVFAIGLIALIFGIQAYENNRFPLVVDGGQEAAEQITQKLKDRGMDWESKKVAYQFSATAYYMNLDPFNRDRIQRFWSIDLDAQPSGKLKNGDLLIWDSMTGTREGRMTWERVQADPHLERLDSVTVREKTLVSFLVRK
ncbi:MAG: hypothetical protein EP346_05995 [Bacteroidetes bacterium]|uniref:Glycosyltransferase family 39 protein n=1 Tax=Phaeocystidibacter marisrubri TaxID=1577780 RepID=A0A6L3ZEZ4_9FLAO|nr:hypothetical protein [Phaeocystidibacter marisrubri]KAB2816401.1 hypothetical protein F8C82_12015 [Phaeocystidibacter marisrubri]TNE29579.1 MAG: hypothetical protein EP346_05995 [Bacteroidota bacterium]GGH68869.1 hypothetical protein GCM10011318_09310 [Phaeocystidibacter marisrubri]